MMKTLAGLIVLAAFAAACTDSGTGPRLAPGGVTTPTLSVISMTPSVAVEGAEVTFASRGLFECEDYTRNWDFGDGATAQGPSVTHVYRSRGSYDVVLVACDGVTVRRAILEVNVAPAGTPTPPPPDEVRQP
jgi:chitodextrinase